MRIGIPRERRNGEHRVATVPDVVKTYVAWGWDVLIEAGAGVAAGFPDDLYVAAGATIVDNAFDADLVLVVGPPSRDEVERIDAGTTLVGFLDPFVATDVVQACLDRRLTAIAVEAIPRTTLAQSMDALSSQANIAGYAAVLVGATGTPKLLPMMVTAAGTIPPSRALILGVGVAGLQAIATAKRLGAVVHAYDIRTETREQVESLGAKFVEAITTEADEGGYAKEVAEDAQAQQHAALAPHVAASDLIVTTAQIPGRPAPLLVTEDMVRSMHPGSVIVDMAAATGGNVALSLPDEVVEIGGVAIHGPTNLASMFAADASRMYARNLLALLQRARDEATGGVTVDLEDEIIGGATITVDGAVHHPRTKALMEGAAS
jgi:NAD(P) transhydrogenase subunit alpha